MLVPRVLRAERKNPSAECGPRRGIASRKDRTVKNSKKKTKAVGRDTVVNDWQPLFARLQDTIDWALDIALKLARDYQEDIDAIERTRAYVHALIDGRRKPDEIRRSLEPGSRRARRRDGERRQRHDRRPKQTQTRSRATIGTSGVHFFCCIEDRAG